MKIQIIVCCTNSNGEPDALCLEHTCTQEQYDNGDHYDQVKAHAENLGYEGPFWVADENDPGWRIVSDRGKGLTDDQAFAIRCAVADLVGGIQAAEEGDIHAHDWDGDRDTISDLLSAFPDLELHEYTKPLDSDANC